MPVTSGEIVEALFAHAPRELAEPWDNIGLVVGDPRVRVRRALLCVDATEEIIAEAKRARARLVVAHHPPFVEPLKRARADEGESAVACAAARAGIGICAMHTNLDYAPAGLCVELARVVGLADLRPLAAAGASSLIKLAVFVPQDHLTAVRQAMATAGAGRIGGYDECSFGVEGVGTYRPLAGARPYVGAVGRLEQAAEVRLEMVVPRTALSRVLAAMEQAHPYEEVACDLYALANPWPNSARGALGRLPRATTLSAFGRRVRQALDATTVRIGGDARRRIRTVAVASGSGGSLIGEAAAAGADALLLGELRHHDALRARALGLGLIEAGHYATERPAVELMRRWLEEAFGARIEIIVSRLCGDPFAFALSRPPA
ncbi:MAG TPA: Nif3-like dinuclear metal center hexameric protein [Armatimonadota bacterium]|nr:Nif3-like dinuclear metal center hexameric protein [Armatimonadota bacterium]